MIRSYVSPFYHRKGPNLLVRFYVVGGQICHIELSLNSETGLAWQIYSDSSITKLEDLINEWMEDYVQKKTASKELPLLMQGFPFFTTQVLQKIKSIPFSHSMTYQQLAQLMGKPQAPRAIGNACRRNPFLLVIPCHRVLAAGSKIGGFSAGLEIKKQLLAFEDIQF